MSATPDRAARRGRRAAGIELRQTFTNAADLWSYLLPGA